jgi:hypothetical protein
MKLLFIGSFLSLYSLAYSQFDEPKFGKIEMNYLIMSKFDKDTTAGALMLFDSGSSNFFLNEDQQFQFSYNRHCQIKIFKKSSFDIADMSIRLYESGNRKEKLQGLKAMTYNLVDGKITKTKLDNDKIYRAKGENYENVNFAFPEVREGSIIELSYTIVSDFLYNFRGWTFQYAFPAIWSQYRYEIPEYFEYRESSKGYLNFDVLKREIGSVSFVLPGEYEDLGREGLKKTQGQVIRASSIKNTYGISNVPAFISEPNIDCEDNYVQAIEFELSMVTYPNQAPKSYTSTWESVNTQMQDDKDFGLLLNNPAFMEDTIQTLCKGKSKDIDKAIEIYNHIQKRMKWNETYSKWSMNGLKKPYNDGIGNSSEINLLLTLMLRNAGLKANPVLFSTRENGLAITYYPTISKFNSVLSMVVVEGKTYLLDAVSKNCPFGVLPASDINGKGRVVNSGNGDWVDLNATVKYTETKSYSLEISPEGKFTGTVSGNYDGYAGIYYRNSINGEKSKDDYIRKMQENMNGLTVINYVISGTSDNYKPVTDSLNVEISDHTEMIGDKILFYPLLYERTERNRYTLEDRKYPINYNYPISESYRFIYTLPSGYVVESMPKSATLTLPGNSAVINFTARNIDNKILIEYTREINKIMFLPEEYTKLKEFYNQLVKIQAEQVILKKSL